MIAGIGIDIVDIERMRLALQRTPRIAKKILTQDEYDDLCDTSDNKFIESLAARFAAKEATVKSLGLSLFAVGLHSIEISKNTAGAPSINFPSYKSFLAENTDPAQSDISFLCSLTHTTQSAAAVVVAQYVS